VSNSDEKEVGSMNQRLTDNGTKNGKILTFLIETQLADKHPGVIRLRELRNGSRRFLKDSFLFLYKQNQEQGTVGEAIARCIYQDQIENRQGRYKGPRWDFQQPCQIQMIQIIERLGLTTGQKEKVQKREIGQIHLSSGVSAQAIISQIGHMIDTGWQAPPEEAYRDPDDARIDGLSTSSGNRFPLIVEFEQNYHQRKGAVVFLATEDDGVSLDQCALLPLEEKSTKPSLRYYYLFSFEDTGSALYLCDQGVHTLSKPLILGNGDFDRPSYWVHQDIPLRVEGGMQVELSAICGEMENIQALFAEALPNYTIYCGACRKEYRPALSAEILQEASRVGYVTTLCTHTYWCPRCQRWSTIEERVLRLATSEACTHPRPTGWESRLTNNALEMNAPTPAQSDTTPELPPPHPYYVISDVHHWLPGQVFPPRNPGKFLTDSMEKDLNQVQPGEQSTLQLVSFKEDCYFDTSGG
jgi:hypothetical protein